MGKEGLFGIGGLAIGGAIGGALGYFLRGNGAKAAPPDSDVKNIASRVGVESVWPEQVYCLTNKYLLNYIHWPATFTGYLYACLLQESNVDCLFSINTPNPADMEPAWYIEFTRLTASEQNIYWDGELAVTFPAYVGEPGVPMLGYYILKVGL